MIEELDNHLHFDLKSVYDIHSWNKKNNAVATIWNIKRMWLQEQQSVTNLLWSCISQNWLAEWIHLVPKLLIISNYSKVSTFPGQVPTIKVQLSQELFTLVTTLHFGFFLRPNTIVSKQSLLISTTVSMQLSASHTTNKQTMQEEFTEKVVFLQQCPLERY